MVIWDLVGQIRNFKGQRSKESESPEGARAGSPAGPLPEDVARRAKEQRPAEQRPEARPSEATWELGQAEGVGHPTQQWS